MKNSIIILVIHRENIVWQFIHLMNNAIRAIPIVHRKMSMDKQPSERRQHVRIQARFAVMMKLDRDKFPDYTMEAEVVNISEGGVLLSLPDKRTSQSGAQDIDTSFYYGDLQLESLLTWHQFRLPNSGELV